MSPTSQNNTKDKVNVNTSGIQFYNKDGFDPSVLSLGFWNDKLSIKINPALEKSKQTEKNVFDYEHAAMTSLTVDKMQTLLNSIEDNILQALMNNEERSVSVIINLDSLVTVGTGVALTGRVAPYLAIHKSLKKETQKPESSIYYEFKSSPIVLDYDALSGKYDTATDRFGEFKSFINCIRFAIPTLMNAGVHANRHADKYYRDKVIADISAVAAKLGVEIGTGAKTFSSRPDVFGTRGGQSTTPPQVGSGDHSETIESLDNFMD